MIDAVADRFVPLIFHNQALLYALGSLLVAYLLWRGWSFTIRPMLRPHEPRPLPYLIPFLGMSVISWPRCIASD